MDLPFTKQFHCPICDQEKNSKQGLAGKWVRPPLREFIQARFPDWDGRERLCFRCLDRMRWDYMAKTMAQERGELTALEQEVFQSLQEHEVTARNINLEFERDLTFGEKVSDKIAEFGGSWRFILTFLSIMMVWIIINTIALMNAPFDPYPYILLNLVLSCLAALQAPIIMMSQNRQEDRDRMRAEHDYRVNLKAELEIRHLHAKIDQLVSHQWERLLEIQQIQMEMLEEIVQLSKRHRS